MNMITIKKKSLLTNLVCNNFPIPVKRSKMSSKSTLTGSTASSENSSVNGELNNECDDCDMKSTMSIENNLNPTNPVPEYSQNKNATPQKSSAPRKKSFSERHIITTPSKEKVGNLRTEFSNIAKKEIIVKSEDIAPTLKIDWSIGKCKNILSVITTFYSKVAYRWDNATRDSFVKETQMLLDFLYISHEKFQKHKEVF